MPAVVSRFIRDDGMQVICIVEREDGRFSLVEERETWTQACESDVARERFWTTVESTTLHDTLVAAQREGASKFGWTRGAAG
jgi:hypothetical protein